MRIPRMPLFDPGSSERDNKLFETTLHSYSSNQITDQLSLNFDEVAYRLLKAQINSDKRAWKPPLTTISVNQLEEISVNAFWLPAFISSLQKSLPFKCVLQPGNLIFYASDLFITHAVEFITTLSEVYGRGNEGNGFLLVSAPNFPIQKYHINAVMWESLVSKWEGSQNCTKFHTTSYLLAIEAREPFDVQSNGTPQSVGNGSNNTSMETSTGCVDCSRIEHRIEELENLFYNSGRVRIPFSQQPTISCPSCKTNDIMSWAERCPKCSVRLKESTSCGDCKSLLFGKFCHNCGKQSPSVVVSRALTAPLSPEMRTRIKNTFSKS